MSDIGEIIKLLQDGEPFGTALRRYSDIAGDRNLCRLMPQFVAHLDAEGRGDLVSSTIRNSGAVKYQHSLFNKKG